MRVSPPLPSPLHRYTFSAVHSRAAEGGFDLWKPAGRFTNIKFAFKRVGADAAEGGSHVCTLHGWIYRVILEEAALERRSRKKRKKKEEKGERKKERITGSFSLLVRLEMGFSNWTRENSSVRRRTLDSSCSLFLYQGEEERGFARCVSGSIGGKQATREGEIN